MDAERPGGTRFTYLEHDVPRVTVRLSQRPDGSVVFNGVAYRLLTPSGDPYEYTITVAAEHLSAIRR